MPPRYTQAEREAAFWAKTVEGPVHPTLGPCLSWTGATARGYGIVGWGGKTLRANRVAYALSVGPIPDDEHVLHRCDNTLCVRSAHLFTGTAQANVDDMLAKGREPRGRRHGVRVRAGSAHLYKVTSEQVEEIRAAYARGGVTQAALASRFNLSQRYVSDIVTGRRWVTQ